ncbi:MAG: UPF0280 family protein [Deltaproteobacteria bacterium]|nr:UPF0280 family protein [Deltaproteobacteria bacterium]MBW2133162.1 UPF0280 family protein [Deltaproteobacteria bacterium]
MSETKQTQKTVGLEYRHRVRTRRLVPFHVRVKETDLMVYAEKDLSALTRERILKYRRHIEVYIETHPEFAGSLSPVAIHEPVPRIIQEMAAAARTAHVGPMAAVAGAIAQCVGMDLMSLPEGSPEVIVENGGDVFVKTGTPVTVALYAGKSPLSFKIGLRIHSRQGPMGVCTSSGTVGHSLSLGKADAVCVLSPSCPLADAAATAVGNAIRSGRDIPKGIDCGQKMEGVTGIVAVVGGEMGVWGDVELVRL